MAVESPPETGRGTRSYLRGFSPRDANVKELVAPPDGVNAGGTFRNLRGWPSIKTELLTSEKVLGVHEQILPLAA